LKDIWSTVHPQLDPADNYDPLQRMTLLPPWPAVGTFQDPLRTRTAPGDSFCPTPRRWALFSGGHLRAETGVAPQGDKPAVTMPQIESAFLDSKPEELGEIIRLLTSAPRLSMKSTNRLQIMSEPQTRLTWLLCQANSQ
jgi:hypothetical protein